jgi:hypothetical protein
VVADHHQVHQRQQHGQVDEGLLGRGDVHVVHGSHVLTVGVVAADARPTAPGLPAQDGDVLVRQHGDRQTPHPRRRGMGRDRSVAEGQRGRPGEVERCHGCLGSDEDPGVEPPVGGSTKPAVADAGAQCLLAGERPRRVEGDLFIGSVGHGQRACRGRLARGLRHPQAPSETVVTGT